MIHVHVATASRNGSRNRPQTGYRNRSARLPKWVPGRIPKSARMAPQIGPGMSPGIDPNIVEHSTILLNNQQYCSTILSIVQQILLNNRQYCWTIGKTVEQSTILLNNQQYCSTILSIVQQSTILLNNLGLFNNLLSTISTTLLNKYCENCWQICQQFHKYCSTILLELLTKLLNNSC